MLVTCRYSVVLCDSFKNFSIFYKRLLAYFLAWPCSAGIASFMCLFNNEGIAYKRPSNGLYTYIPGIFYYCDIAFYNWRSRCKGGSFSLGQSYTFAGYK